MTKQKKLMSKKDPLDVRPIPLGSVISFAPFVKWIY